MKNELTQIIEQEKIIPTQAEFLLQNFKSIFDTAKELEIKARAIKVTSVDQVEEMKKARELRITIKNLRCDANNKRIELKEESIRTGKVIQGFFNVIEALTKPMETYLENQENFAERIKEQERVELAIKRQELLTKYVEDVSVYNLKEMSEAGFNELLKSSEIAYNNRIAEEQKAERERIEKEQKLELHRNRKDLLIPYWAFVKNVDLNDLSLLTEEQFKESLSDAKKSQAAYDKEQKEKDALLKKQQEEIDEQNRKQQEIDDRLAQEKKEKEEQEQKEQEQKRQAQLAPDKDKLATLANSLMLIEYPELKDEKAIEILDNVKELIKKVNIYIVKNINNI